MQKLLFSVLICSLSLAAVAAETIRRLPIDALKQVEFEKNLEQSVSDALHLHLKDRPFIIQVRSSLYKLQTYRTEEETLTTSIPVQQVIQPPVGQPPVGQPIVARPTASPESDSVPLPGVPFVPRSAQTQSSTLIQNSEPSVVATQETEPKTTTITQTQQETKSVERLVDSRTVIDRLSLTLWIPSDLEPSRISYINELVAEKARINLVRGDSIKTILTDFPSTASPTETQNPLKPEAPPLAPIPPVASTEIEEKPLMTAEQIQQWYEQYPWLFWLLVGAILLLLWRLLNRQDKTPHIPAVPYQDMPYVAHNYPAHQKLQHDPGVQQLEHNQIEDIKHTQRLSIFNEDIVSAVMLNDHMLANTLETSPSSDEAAKTTAWLIHLLGEDVVVKYAQGNLSPEILAQAKEQGATIAQASIEEQCNWAKAVYDRLKHNTLSQKNIHSRPFDFLNEMSDVKLKGLLDEDPQARGLVLSQIEKKRAARMLASFTPDEQASIATSMSRLAELPLLSYRGIAAQLARKAQQIPEINEIQIDGTEALIQTLESMDLASETMFLDALNSQNPDQYYKIKRLYINFDDIPKIPEAALRNFLREIERDTLATALYDADDSIRNHLLSTLTDRSRLLVIRLLETMETPANSDIAQAKQAISAKARALLRAKAFEMPSEHLEDQSAPIVLDSIADDEQPQ